MTLLTEKQLGPDYNKLTFECDDCGERIEAEEGVPLEDALEMLADAGWYTWREGPKGAYPQSLHEEVMLHRCDECQEKLS